MRYLSLLLLCSMTLLACGEDEVVQAPDSGSGTKKARKPKAAEEETKDRGDVPPPVDFQETAFIESERSRDPFRNYARAFVDEARGQVESQREVMLEQYTIDELRLVALIQRVQPERAMLVDPSGLGHVVTRGQFIGKASVVQPTGGSGAAYEVNWRVDRIRDGDLVLVRDDPSNPEVPSATRVVPLRTEEVSARDPSAEASDGAGLQSELKKMQERLAAMAAAEAAKARTEE